MTPAELAAFLDRATPLFRRAACRLSAIAEVRADVVGELQLAVVELAEAGDPQLARLVEASASGIQRWASWRGMDALRAWLREAGEPLPEYGCAAPEPWQPPGKPVCRRTRVGQRAQGDHIATEQELLALFRSAAEVSDGLADAADMAALYDAATPAQRVALRQRASGFTAAEIGSRRWSQTTDLLTTLY